MPVTPREDDALYRVAAMTRRDASADAVPLSEATHFRSEEVTFDWLEATLWRDGPVCPHCGGTRRIGRIKPNRERRVRLGLHRCGNCKRQFTVKVGTIFEHARMPLHKLLQAAYLICSSEKGISAHQLHLILDVQYRSAWTLAQCLRSASGSLGPGPSTDVDPPRDVTEVGDADAGRPRASDMDDRASLGARSHCPPSRIPGRSAMADMTDTMRPEGDPLQYERFVRAARALQCDDDPERFRERVRQLTNFNPRKERHVRSGGTEDGAAARHRRAEA